MDRACESCGTNLQGRSSRARFCGSSCRRKAHETAKRTAEVVQLPRRTAKVSKAKSGQRRVTVPASDPKPLIGIAEAMLEAYPDDELATPVGALARKLAVDVDGMLAGTPGYAAVAKELRAALAELDKRSASRKANPLLELRRRRAQDRASG